MATVRPLRNPPITEALVDIRMATEAAFDRIALAPLEEELRPRFPQKQERRGFVAQFRVERGKLGTPASRELGFQGVWLTSQDGSQIAQFRPDGFTLNNVGRYIGGDALLEQAMEIWTLFAARILPKSVNRVALRYLNRIDLPVREGETLRRFLVAPPELPPGAPQMVSGFLSRVIAHDDTGATAIVTQKLEGSAPPQGPAVIVDIDVFRSGDFAVAASELMPILQVLRDLKNRTFFSLLTEEAVTLYA